MTCFYEEHKREPKSWPLQRKNSQTRCAKGLWQAASSAVIPSTQNCNGEARIRKSHSILAAAYCSSLSRQASSTFGSRDGGTARLLWEAVEIYCLWLSTVGGLWISLNPSGHIHQPVADRGGLIPSLLFTEKSTDFSTLYAFLIIRYTVEQLKAKFNTSLHIIEKTNWIKLICWCERAWRMLLRYTKCADLLLKKWEGVNLVSSRGLLICRERTAFSVSALSLLLSRGNKQSWKAYFKTCLRMTPPAGGPPGGGSFMRN